MEATTYSETFALLAELALALAGFGGVAAAFGGRERAFRATEIIRIRAVFFSSGIVLVGSLAIQTLLAVDQLAAHAIRIAAFLSLAVHATWFATSLPAAYRSANAPDSTSELWALNLSSAYAISGLILYGWCAWSGQAWPLLGASSIHLLFGLWMFTRILTRPN
ncbi:MAG: hypothetical protein AB8G23_24635 [Myxococcota bacterium]